MSRGTNSASASHSVGKSVSSQGGASPSTTPVRPLPTTTTAPKATATTYPKAATTSTTTPRRSTTNSNPVKAPKRSTVSVATSTTSPPSTTTTTTTAGAPAVALGITIDPSYTQDPTNPLKVTYSFSASATQTANGTTTPDPSLPQGVLNFFSDGSLACSDNVGGSVDSGTCTVTYAAIGNHTVVTIYDSGTNSATETDVENIQPVIVNVTPASVYAACATYEPAGYYNANSGVITFNYDLIWPTYMQNPGVTVSMSTPSGDAIVNNSEQLMSSPPNTDLSVTLSYPGGTESAGGFSYVWQPGSESVVMNGPAISPATPLPWLGNTYRWEYGAGSSWGGC